jgi:hypothetical protein
MNTSTGALRSTRRAQCGVRFTRRVAVLTWSAEAIRRVIGDEVSTEHPAEQRCMRRAIRDGPARGGAAG